MMRMSVAEDPMMRMSVVFWVCLLAIGCPANSPVVTSDVQRACAQLRALGCPEGLGAPGLESCETIVARRHDLRPLPLACWSSAPDVPSARGCGSLRCVP